jgi:phosphoribosylaminoimidazole-succinocarboxamide synthase
MTVASEVDHGRASHDDNFQSLRKRFDSLPLIVEGESKIVRQAGDGLTMVRLKPTLFSYSANRAAVVQGTETLRLRISAILWKTLEESGIAVGICHVGDDYYVAELVTPPPIEVIVKAAHVGTPKHLYKGLESARTRHGGFIAPEMRHAAYVRFDWRNPLPEKDECMPLWLADQFIDTRVAERTALSAFDVLQKFLGKRGIELLDICFFITADGKSIFGEVSPDCMRAKYRADDLDKDLWRRGKDAATIIAQWSAFLRLIEAAD